MWDYNDVSLTRSQETKAFSNSTQISKRSESERQTMVTLIPPRSPRSVAHDAAAPTNPEALDPSSASRDINEIVEDAAKRFENMDAELKSLTTDLKNYQASMKSLSENRLKTARHLEAFAANAPFASFVSTKQKAVVGNEALPGAGSGSAGSVSSDETEPRKDTNENESQVSDDVEEQKEAGSVADDDKSEGTTDSKQSGENVKPAAVPKQTTPTTTETPKLVFDTESFTGVYEAADIMTGKYQAQFGDYLISYVENWERTVSQRIQGLLIHYRELQENATHYNKKVGGLLHKVDRTKNVGHRLAERLDRNEIKEMGAVEARDTVGEHLYLYIEEVMERAWRDAFPLLLRACRFEADYSAAQANILGNLVAVAETIQVMGQDEDCSLMGRLEDLEKKHPEEIYTEENPFVKLTPRKKKGKVAFEASESVVRVVVSHLLVPE